MINKLYFVIIFFFVSCSEIDENEVESSAEDLIDWTSIDLTNDFVVGNFDEKGINKTKLQAELDNISDFFRSDLYSLGVLYKGKLIIENYYSGNADSRRPIWSITKSVLSSGYGHLIYNNQLLNTETPLSLFYSLDTAEKSSINIGNLLMMNSGVGDNLGYVSKSDPIQYILSEPLTFSPGTWWAYTSAGTHLLSDIMTKATGQTTKDYLDKHILNPIGIYNYDWESIKEVHNGGFGINFRLLDMLRFGQFYLQKGKSGNKQILSQEWVDISTQGLVNFNAERGYGFLWWIDKQGDDITYSARGYSGQFIVVNPKRALVICVSSRTRNNNFDYLNGIDSFIKQLINSFDIVQ